MTWNATSAWSLTPSCANCVAVNTEVAQKGRGECSGHPLATDDRVSRQDNDCRQYQRRPPRAKHPTDPTGNFGLDLGSPTKNAHASAHSFIAGLRRSLARNPTFLAFYVGTADARFRAENEQLDRELAAANVPHLFRIYAGAHDQSLWTQHAATWLAIALDHLEVAS